MICVGWLVHGDGGDGFNDNESTVRGTQKSVFQIFLLLEGMKHVMPFMQFLQMYLSQVSFIQLLVMR